MFFKNFFVKTFKHFKDKGDKYLEAEQYADARHEYLEALERVGDCEDPAGSRLEVLTKLVVTGDRLALLNITEAGYALAGGDADKAADHVRLAKELGKDPALLAQAAQLEKKLAVTATSQPAATPAKGHSCGGCVTTTAPSEGETGTDSGQLLAEDRFGFLLHTLPESLAVRYSAMGETFAEAYLAAHDGDERKALTLYQELAGRDQDNDILLYEIAIIHFKARDIVRCEQLLRKALDVNPHNELCCLGMVQFLTETGRAPESISLLERMVAEKMMAGQAVITLGDVLLMLGDEEKAMETLMPALKTPSLAKAAAERLIPLLEKRNRRDEAAYLFKTHMKGCC